jgi:hypothetical protein
MSYVTEERIRTRIPATLLNDALDDDRDGAADDGLLEEILQAASDAVDGLLSGQYRVPFAAPYPAPVREAAFVFACELIYDRRQLAEKNPFQPTAAQWRTTLGAVGRGQTRLDALTGDSYPAAWGSATPVSGRLGGATTFLLSLGLLLCPWPAATCHAAHLQVSTEDFLSEPLTNRMVSLMLLSVPTVNGASLVVPELRKGTTDVTGALIFSNVVTGSYQLTIQATPPAVFRLLVPASNALCPAAGLITGVVFPGNALDLRYPSIFSDDFILTTNIGRLALELAPGSGGVTVAAGTNILVETNGQTYTVSGPLSPAMLDGKLETLNGQSTNTLLINPLLQGSNWWPRLGINSDGQIEVSDETGDAEFVFATGNNPNSVVRLADVTSAYQPISDNLTAVSTNNAINLTNLPAAKVVGAMTNDTSGHAAGATNLYGNATGPSYWWGSGDKTNGVYNSAAGQVVSNALGSVTISSGNLAASGAISATGALTAPLLSLSAGGAGQAALIDSQPTSMTNQFFIRQTNATSGRGWWIDTNGNMALYGTLVLRPHETNGGTLTLSNAPSASVKVHSSAYLILDSVSGTELAYGGGIKAHAGPSGFGVGTASPAYPLHVVGNANVTGALTCGSTVAATNGLLLPGSSAVIKFIGVTSSNPPASSADTAFLFAATNAAGTAEIFTIDGAGTVKQISEHAMDAPPSILEDDDPFPNISKEINVYLGKVRWINRSREAQMTEKLLALNLNSPHFWTQAKAKTLSQWTNSNAFGKWTNTVAWLDALDQTNKDIVLTETFVEYNARLGLTNGDGLVVSSWSAVQDGISNQWFATYSAATNAYAAALAEYDFVVNIGGDTNAVPPLAPAYSPPVRQPVPVWLRKRGVQ